MVIMEFPTKREQNDLDSSQESQQSNPIVSNRRSTDKFFVLVFLLTILAWTKTCSSVQPSFVSRDSSFDIIIMRINAPVLRSSDGRFIWPLIISIVGVFFYTLLTEKTTKIFIRIGQLLYAFTTIITSIQVVVGTKEIVLDLSKILDNAIFWISAIIGLMCLTWGWAYATSMVVSCFSFLEADKKELCDIAKDSCQVVLRSPFIILFMGFIATLAYFVFSLTINALLLRIFDERNESLLYFYSVAIVLGGLCALGFLYFIASMVVSAYTINYYWEKDEKALSLFGRSIVSTMRYHIGTIMFASTIFISSICGIVQAFKHKRLLQNKESSIFYYVSKVYLALRISDFALICSSIYGTGFVKSSQTTFNEVLRRPSLFLATLAAYEGIFINIPLLLLILGVKFAAITVPVGDPRTQEAILNISLLLHGLILPLICFACLMYFTMKALLINKIIILNKENSDFLQYSDAEKKSDIFGVYNDCKFQTLSV